MDNGLRVAPLWLPSMWRSCSCPRARGGPIRVDIIIDIDNHNNINIIIIIIIISSIRTISIVSGINIIIGSRNIACGGT